MATVRVLDLVFLSMQQEFSFSGRVIRRVIVFITCCARTSASERMVQPAAMHTPNHMTDIPIIPSSYGMIESDCTRTAQTTTDGRSCWQGWCACAAHATGGTVCIRTIEHSTWSHFHCGGKQRGMSLRGHQSRHLRLSHVPSHKGRFLGHRHQSKT